MDRSRTEVVTGGAGEAWVPLEACTLPAAEQPLRVAAFDEVFRTSLRDVQRSGSQKARLVFEGDDGLTTRLQELVTAEAACCSFFSFTLTSSDADASSAADDRVVVLDVEVPAAHTDVLDALVTRADQARRAAS